jgi:hypothetical protein
MTWTELEAVALSAIQSELGNIPKTMAQRVAKRIVDDVQVELIKGGWTAFDLHDEVFIPESKK